MTRSNNRFIPGEEIGAVVDWNFSAVDQSSVRFAAKLKEQAMAEEQARDEEVRQAGYSEGYAQGYAQGHAQATLEGQRLINEYIETQGAEAARNFGLIFESARAQLAESEQVMAKGVLELACELARQVLRHELSANPNALLPVVREALSVLASDTKAAVVRMNPLDMDVLAEELRQEFVGLSLTLLADGTITRGGCLVESAGTVVDGTLEKRWARGVASLGLESSWEVSDDVH
ncbi:MAG: flagellar assembly protein FliH [Rhodoferax sp.]